MIDNPMRTVILSPGKFLLHHLNTVHGSHIKD